MSKRIIALLLCAFMLIPCFTACSNQTDKDKEEDLGAYITMYLTDTIYDFDPANAFYNQNTINVVSMLYDTLFTLNEKGKVKESLVKKYTIKEDKENNEYSMEIKLNNTKWSNGTRLSADDVVYAWKRLLKSSNNFPAASLLYDIKNARAVKEGDESIDDIGIEAVAIDVVKVIFEGPIDYDQFVLNLTSVATAPLLENYVEKNVDWAKKPSSMVTSGPYKLGKINYKQVLDSKGNPEKVKDDYALDQYGVPKTPTTYELMEINYFYLERNVHYNRNAERDKIDSSVKNYRILVDCSKSAEDILEDYKDGKIFYMGEIPLSLRSDDFVTENAKISNALSTFVLYMNENAKIKNGSGGEKLFANADVRKALSLAIDRDAIAQAIVYADAATGLVCPGVFNVGTKGDFREVGTALLETSPKINDAKNLLTQAGIDATKYSFTIKVAGYDEENIKITEMVAEAWTQLGFKVTVEKTSPIVNNDVLKELVGSPKDTPADICDDLFVEALQRTNYEVIAFDYTAYSADAYSMLSSFANSFSGMALVESVDENGAPVYSLTPHYTGYVSEEYDALMEAIYYIPYFASFTEEQLADDTFTFLSIYDTKEEFMETYNKVKAVYDANGIVPSTKKSDWTAQKATLLHKAEEMLLEDMPVIPVVFNKNAVMVRGELSKVTSTYYIPAYFRKTVLKDYAKYTEALAEFPEVDWDLVE